MNADGTVKASLTVKNTGERDGDEIVQLYIHDVSASIARPVKELKGFQRIHLKSGEAKTVTFDITRKQLEFYNSELKQVVEPGEFTIMVGSNSRDVKTAKLTVEKKTKTIIKLRNLNGFGAFLLQKSKLCLFIFVILRS